MVGIYALNIFHASRIQEILIPTLLNNPKIDFWVTSNPGSGKTLAYAIAVLSRIDTTRNYVQAVCMVASPEAATQTASFMRRLGIYKNIKVGIAVKTDGSMYF